MFPICRPQPNWIPRNPKLIFQICQNESVGLAIGRYSDCRLRPALVRQGTAHSVKPDVHHRLVRIAADLAGSVTVTPPLSTATFPIVPRRSCRTVPGTRCVPSIFTVNVAGFMSLLIATRTDWLAVVRANAYCWSAM